MQGFILHESKSIQALQLFSKQLFYFKDPYDITMFYV